MQVEEINSRFGVDLATKQTADVARVYGIYLESIIPRGETPLTGAPRACSLQTCGQITFLSYNRMLLAGVQYASAQQAVYTPHQVDMPALYSALAATRHVPEGAEMWCCCSRAGAREDNRLQRGPGSLGQRRCPCAPGCRPPLCALFLRGRLKRGQRSGAEGAALRVGHLWWRI